MSGRFAMKRGWRENALFRNEPFNKACAWVWMIERACFEATKFDINGKIVTLQRSQFCSSVRQLADEWKWSKSSVERFLNRLKTETMIETDIGTGKLIITICNYDKHQFTPKNSGTALETPVGTGAGQERDTKEEVNKEIRDNTSVLSYDAHVQAWLDFRSKKPAKKKSQSTPFPEVFIPQQFKPGTQSRVIVDGWPDGRINTELERFAANHRSRGTVMKDWQSAWSTWVLNTERFGNQRNGNGTYQNGQQPGSVDPVVQAVIASQARRAGEQQDIFGDYAGSGAEVC